MSEKKQKQSASLTLDEAGVLSREKRQCEPEITCVLSGQKIKAREAV